MRGLKNLGNTCYFNTAVQCLSHVPPLAHHLFTHEYVGLCAITFEYQKVLRQLFVKEVSDPVDPTNLLSAFREIFPEFVKDKQHDAQEVIINLIAVFERSLGKEFIGGIFNGEDDGQVFNTKILDVCEPCSLEDLLVNHTVTKWPQVTSFTLGMYNYKFPVIFPFQFENKNLFAVVIHTGRDSQEGHYGLCVKVKDTWYIKEDERVHKIPYQIELMRGEFYMAFYRPDRTL